MGTIIAYLLAATLIVASGGVGYCQSEEGTDKPWRASPQTVTSGKNLSEEPTGSSRSVRGTLWNTTIIPYQSADIGPEVSGIIKEIWVDEGDAVRKGQVLARLVNGRYIDALRKAEARVVAFEAEAKKFEEEVRIQEELFSLKATTRQDLLKAKTDAEVMAARIREARNELDLARKDVEACVIKAPFSGYISQRHKQPNEPIDRMGKLISIVDSTRVYAIANVEEQLAPAFEKGIPAIFIHRSGKSFDGVIERVGPTLDPKARTRKVYCVIENGNAALASGMTGTLRVMER